MEGSSSPEQPDQYRDGWGVAGIAYRGDLQEAIGLIVSQPPHSVTEQGEILWGDWYAANSVGSDAIWTELANFVVNGVEEAMADLDSIPSLERRFPAHTYDHPPAAQSIPEIAVMLWEHGRPILENVSLLTDVALVLRYVLGKIPLWYERKNEDIRKRNEASIDTAGGYQHTYLEPSVTLTQGAIISLLVAELVARVGYQPDLEIDAHARGFMTYNNPGHPNSRLTYLFRIAFAGEQYGYVVMGDGKVIERFQITHNELISLPVPNLLTGEMEEYDRLPSDEKLRLRSLTSD